MKCYNEAELESEKVGSMIQEPLKNQGKLDWNNYFQKVGLYPESVRLKMRTQSLSASRYALSLGVPCCPPLPTSWLQGWGSLENYWRLIRTRTTPRIQGVLYIYHRTAQICLYADIFSINVVGPLCLWALHQLTKHRSSTMFMICGWLNP